MENPELVRTCIINRRIKREKPEDVTISDMKICKNTISFVPVAGSERSECRRIAKLYKKVETTIAFQPGVSCVAMEFVMWDTELQGTPPPPMPSAPVFCFGAMVLTKGAAPSYETPGSVYMCENGVFYRKNDRLAYALPEIAFHSDIDLKKICSPQHPKMQVAVMKNSQKILFFINGAKLCEVYEPSEPYTLALAVKDRRVCSFVMRMDGGKESFVGNLWKVSELSEHKKAHYKDRGGIPYTHGVESLTNDVYGASYEHTVHTVLAETASKSCKPWVIPRVFGLMEDEIGPVLVTEYIDGLSPRGILFNETWKLTGVLCDVITCGNMMWQTRMVHEDFFLRNFLVRVDTNARTVRGTMIDFDRMRCLGNEPEEKLSRWIVATLLAFLMELAYIVFNVTQAQPCVAHTLLRVLDILADNEPIYQFKKGKMVPNWNYWCVWYEGEHECNDQYYFQRLRGTNLKFKGRDGLISKCTPSYPVVMRTVVLFLAQQMYLDEIINE